MPAIRAQRHKYGGNNSQNFHYRADAIAYAGHIYVEHSRGQITQGLDRVDDVNGMIIYVPSDKADVLRVKAANPPFAAN